MPKQAGPNQTEAQRKHAEYMRAWHAAHKESVSAWGKARYQRNKDRVAKQSRAWKESNRDRVNELGRAWYAKNKERRHTSDRRSYLQRAYGLTIEQYDAMLAAQQGVCAICLKAPRERYLTVDHNHATGEVRALLCRHCNAGLGLYDESPELLQRAAAYLNRFTTRKAASS